MSKDNINYIKGFAVSILFHTVIVAFFAMFAYKMTTGQKVILDISTLFKERAVEEVSGASQVPAEPLKKTVKKALSPKESIKPQVQANSQITVNEMLNTEVLDGQETEAAPSVQIGETFQTGELGKAANQAAGYARENFYYIQKRINQKIVYPLAAKRGRQRGKVQVQFTINMDGSVQNVFIASGSGYELLDNAVLNAVSDAAPFPVPPVEATIIVPVDFSLI